MLARVALCTAENEPYLCSHELGKRARADAKMREHDIVRAVSVPVADG
jgi:hypothetical protein